MARSTRNKILVLPSYLQNYVICTYNNMYLNSFVCLFLFWNVIILVLWWPIKKKRINKLLTPRESFWSVQNSIKTLPLGIFYYFCHFPWNLHSNLLLYIFIGRRKMKIPKVFPVHHQWPAVPSLASSVFSVCSGVIVCEGGIVFPSPYPQPC